MLSEKHMLCGNSQGRGGTPEDIDFTINPLFVWGWVSVNRLDFFKKPLIWLPHLFSRGQSAESNFEITALDLSLKLLSPYTG